jgi:biotin carboxyl carrier protein
MICKSGEKVHNGELIAELDITDIESAIQGITEDIHAANISLQNLMRTHERTKDLLAVQGASIEQAQKEQSMIASAKARLETLRQKQQALQNSLSYARIKAPLDGIISKTFVSRGATIMPGKPLLQINAMGKTSYLLIRVPGNINVKGVRFRSRIYPAHPLRNSYHGLAEYKVYVNAGDLISGDRIETSVVLYKGRGIRLPFDTILNRNGRSYVLKITGKQAIPLEVHIIQSGEEGVVVKENLQGEKLVLAKPDILLRLLSGYALKIKD